MDCYHVEAWDILQHLFKVKKINDHILHFAAELSSELNFVSVKQSVGFLANAFPLIRCALDETQSHRPIWADMGYKPEDMVSLIKTENPTGSVQSFLCQEVNLEKGPQIKVGVIRDRKTDTLCVLINHMLCDAAGFKEILYILGSVYTCLERQEEIHISSMVKDRSIGQILKKQPLLDHIKIYFSKTQLNPHGNQKFNFKGDFSNPFIEIRKIPREQFCLIKKYAKSHRASINDIMLTVFLRVLFRTFGYAAALPCAIDLRRFLPNHEAGGICNLMFNICCNIGSDIGENFESTLFKVKQEMDLQKTNLGCVKNIALLEKLFTVCPYKTASGLLNKYFTNPPVAFTNIGVLDKKQLVFGDSMIIDAFMTGSIKYSPYFQVSLTTFDDEATLCVNLYGTQDDRLKIIGFLNDFIDELHEGGLYPMQTC